MLTVRIQAIDGTGTCTLLDSRHCRLLLFHGVIGLPQVANGSAPRVCPRITTSRGVAFRGCRYSVMFRPPNLLAPQIVPTAANTAAGQPGLLRPGTSCFVTAARTGYANRPTSGNWRYGDLHPARLSALSAAPATMPRFQSPPRRTQHAGFPHYAHLFASHQGLWDLSCWGDFRLWSSNPIAVEQLQVLVEALPTPPRPTEALSFP